MSDATLPSKYKFVNQYILKDVLPAVRNVDAHRMQHFSDLVKQAAQIGGTLFEEKIVQSALQ